jgi:hypothetical protein
MGKKKKTMSSATETPPAKAGTNAEKTVRSGVGKMFYLDDELSQALDNFLGAQEFKPTQTTVFSLALKEFLRTRGFYPPKKNGK